MAAPVPERQEAFAPALDLDKIGILLRALASVLGLVMIVIGLWYTLRFIGQLIHVLEDPASIERSIGRWGDVLGADDLVIEINGNTVHYKKIAGGFAMGLVALALVALVLRLITAGAQVVTLTSSDRELIKKILREALPMTTPPKAKP